MYFKLLNLRVFYEKPLIIIAVLYILRNKENAKQKRKNNFFQPPHLMLLKAQ